MAKNVATKQKEIDQKRNDADKETVVTPGEYRTIYDLPERWSDEEVLAWAEVADENAPVKTDRGNYVVDPTRAETDPMRWERTLVDDWMDGKLQGSEDETSATSEAIARRYAMRTGLDSRMTIAQIYGLVRRNEQPDLPEEKAVLTASDATKESIVVGLDEYASHCNPNVAIQGRSGLNAQIALHRLFQYIVAKEGTEFVEAMDVLCYAFKKYRELCFSETYMYRFMDGIPSDAERKWHAGMLMCLSVVTGGYPSQIRSMDLSVFFATMSTDRSNRCIEYFKKYANR